MRSLILPVLQAVAFEFDARVSEVTGHCRVSALVRARFVVSLLLHWKGLSYPEIGWFLGRRDHATIINAVRRAKADTELLLLAARLAPDLGISVPAFAEAVQ